MADSFHAAATQHLPSFITAPGETDVLMVVMAVFLVVFVLMIGLVYFRLHALPDRCARADLRLWRVGECPLRQALRYIESRHADPIVGHPRINVEAIR